MAARAVAAFLAAGCVAGAAASGENLAVAEALASDDECGASGEDDACALNAAQLRAARTSSAAALAADAPAPAAAAAAAQTSAAVSAEAVVKATWRPWSSSSSHEDDDYNARCFSHVGDEECKSSSSAEGRCVCENGCMGADGSCYGRNNTLVADKFTLGNAKWPDYKMYVKRMSIFGQLSTTNARSSFNMGQDLFRLYELPGTHSGQKEYFLASAKWPDYVVSLQNTGGTSFSLWAAYAVSLKKKHRPWNLKNIMLRVCSARKLGFADGIMLGSGVTTGGSTVWTYVHKGSWGVYGYWYPEQLIEKHIMAYGSKAEQAEADPSIKSTPDEGGIWFPDPPLPAGTLPDC